MDQDEGGELGEVHDGLNRHRVGAEVFLFVMSCNCSSGSLSVTSSMFVMSCNCSSGSLSVTSSILCTWG